MNTSNGPDPLVQDLRVYAAVTDGQAVVRLSGELDRATAPLLDETLDELRAGGVSTLVVNLAQLAFIDSSGLHVLLSALTRQRELGGDVVLQEPNPQLVRVLDMVGLSQVFTIT